MNLTSSTSPDEGLVLPGLDGTNPLGFLATLGTLRVLSLGRHSVKLSWRLSGGTWRPMLFGVPVALDELGSELHFIISNLDQSAWSIDKKLPFKANLLRRNLNAVVAAASHQTRQKADDLTSFGVEFYADKDGLFEKTELCMVRTGDSVGQGLTAYARQIIGTIESRQLQQTVEMTWMYNDDEYTLRWDPNEDKPYAMQWRNPSKVRSPSQKGANCLALFGMGCFPVVPVSGQAETTGFGLKRPKQVSWTWPLWNYPVPLNVVHSLLALTELQREKPSRSELEPLGIAAVYRCDRIMTSTYYANFTPARRVA